MAHLMRFAVSAPAVIGAGVSLLPSLGSVAPAGVAAAIQVPVPDVLPGRAGDRGLPLRSGAAVVVVSAAVRARDQGSRG